MTTLKPPLAGSVLVLTPSEIPLLKEHLLRLDSDGRRQRFNGLTSERFVERYNTEYITDGTVVIGYFADGEMRGAAELHPPDDQARRLPLAWRKSFSPRELAALCLKD